MSPQLVSFLVGLRTYQHIYIYIYSNNISPIIIINRIYETQNLLSLQLDSFLVELRTYQHTYIYIYSNNISPIIIINRIYEIQNPLSPQLVFFLVGLKTYQHSSLCPLFSFIRKKNHTVSLFHFVAFQFIRNHQSVSILSHL